MNNALNMNKRNCDAWNIETQQRELRMSKQREGTPQNHKKIRTKISLKK